MDKIIVRQARRTELDIIAKIQCRAWRDAFGDIITARTMEKYTDPEGCAHFLKRVYDSGEGVMYIAGIGNKACGTLFWRKNNARDAEIIALHTLKRVWGKDVGRALMNKALSDMFRDGVCRVSLWVFRDNIRARRFYEKCGFSPTGGERISIYDRALEVEYRRML